MKKIAFLFLMMKILLLVACSGQQVETDKSKDSSKLEKATEIVDLEAKDVEEMDADSEEIENDVNGEDNDKGTAEGNNGIKEVEQNAPFNYDMDQLTFRMDKDKTYEIKRFYDGKEINVVQTYIETIENEKGIWDKWHIIEGTDEYDFLVMEDANGLYVGHPESEYFQSITYPVEEGSTFQDWEDLYTIVEVNMPITVEAGSFEHVVAVESPEGSMTYYAPNVGAIQTIDEAGKVISELTGLNE